MTNPSPVAPVAPARPYTFEHLGRQFEDPFFWMQERSDPALMPWIDAENGYAVAMLAPLQPLRQRLYAELLGRIQEDDASAPVQHGSWLYFARTSKGESYRRLYRRALPNAANPNPSEVLLLDENELARGRAYCRILRAAPSPDHTRLA
ncbi:MAG: oligopeptidase B, partial [Caldilineaceae bacterium]